MNWYERIRVDVCRGISTKTLAPDLQERFWAELKRRCAKKYKASGYVSAVDFFKDRNDFKYIPPGV